MEEHIKASSADEKLRAGLALLLFDFTILHFQNIFHKLDFLWNACSNTRG